MFHHCKDLISDPSLFGDSGAWSNYETYQKYVRAASSQKIPSEVSFSIPNNFTIYSHSQEAVCGTQAGTSSRDRPHAHYSVAGVFAIQCKHGLYQPNGVADFPKGERYVKSNSLFETFHCVVY